MTSHSANQARAALEALFETRPAFVAAPEQSFDTPTNLDEVIAADAALTWGFDSYRWYRGRDTRGVLHVFRFQRGKPVTDWQSQLRAQRLLSVEGPFRTSQQATAAH